MFMFPFCTCRGEVMETSALDVDYDLYITCITGDGTIL